MKLILCDFLGETRLEVSAKEVASTLPCRRTVQQLLHVKCTETLTIVSVDNTYNVVTRTL